MAFQDMVGGNCAGVNPLRNLASHMNGDKSLQREGLRPDQLDDIRHERFAAHENNFTRDFFQQDGGASSSKMAAGPWQQAPGPGPLSGMRLADVGRPRQDDWVNEFEGMRMSGAVDNADFHHFEQIYRQPMGQKPGNWANEFQADARNFQPVLTPAEFSDLEQYYHGKAAPKITELPNQWASEFAQKEETKNMEAAWANDDVDQVINAALDEAANGGAGMLDDDLEEYFGNQEWPDETTFSPKRVPVETYQFEPTNVFMDHPSPLEEGLRLSNNGNLSDAALALEAAVRRDPTAEAWYQLGAVQAENEKESAAISALQEAVRLDPSHLEASLALAISYTNESAEVQALEVLSNWISIKYPDVPPVEKTRFLRVQQVVDQFLHVVRSSPEVDADVQVGLGALFNLSTEYDKAADCFRTALTMRPDDYRLHNRYGATLANGRRSEEAIAAYHAALDLKPSFVRARYNLGVGCINIGCYKEAAEHFLGSLALHGGNAQRNVSNNLWDTLGRTLVMMNRRDLMPAAHARDLESFRAEFDF